MCVSHITVAMNTGHRLISWIGRQHLMHQPSMTINTGALGNTSIARLDLDWFVKVFQREGKRMKKAVIGLGHPFTNWIVRKVTIVADGHVSMAGFLPRIKMPLHHMAIGASRGIITEIAGPLPIAKGKNPHARQNAKHDRQRNTQYPHPSQPAKSPPP